MSPPHSTSWRSILILSSHLCLCLPRGLFPLGLPNKTLYTPLIFPYTCYMPHPSPSSWFDHPNNILWSVQIINPLTPNDSYCGRTAPLTSKRCILYIYSTNVGTEYFKHGLYSLFYSLQNAVCFIILTSLVPVLSTFYIQGVLKLKK